MSEAMLELRGLHARYGNTQVLNGIDLDVAQGQITVVLGANGAGKTTTLRSICQMMAQTTGSIRFKGQRIDGQSTEKIARAGVGHVPDGRGTFLGLTTEENLRLGTYARPSRAGIAEDLERIYHYFPRLKERMHQQAGTLSGGEQQMLAIGRALMGKPRLLLLDEPSFGLAPLVVRDIFSIMQCINQQERVAILLVEQNAQLALELADYAFLLETGSIVLSGTAAQMRSNDAVRRAYLGD